MMKKLVKIFVTILASLAGILLSLYVIAYCIGEPDLNKNRYLKLYDDNQEIYLDEDEYKKQFSTNTNFRYANHNGINTEGLDEKDIEEINRFVEFIKNKKKNEK